MTTRPGRGIAVFVLFAGLLLGGVHRVSAQDLPLPVEPFADLTDLWRLTSPMNGGTGQTSSYDRTGGNADAIFWYYLRAHSRRAVMADLRGPGCVSRIWVTAFDPNTARIEIFLDGSATPVVSAWMRDFFGNLPPFVPPLATPSTGSWVSYVPIPFRRSCRIEAVNARQDNNVIYYNVSYRTYASGEPLGEVFQMPPSPAQQTALSQLATQWTNRGLDPKPAQPGQQSLTGAPFLAQNGGSATLANLAGAGVIAGIRVTINPNATDALFNARIRCRWDGSATYAVDAPLGAFFGCGFGPANAVGLPLGHKDGHRYCYFPMPYSNGATIELYNPSATAFTASYTVTYVPKSLAEVGRLRFHAEARSRTPATGGSPSYRILSSPGRGHFLGCVLSIQSRDANWGVLEGDEYIYVDGENFASIRGTGTEDYFNGGFYYSGGPVSLPFSGAPVVDNVNLRTSSYRLCVTDPVVFRNGLVADIEHGGVNEANGDYYSVAFFYRDDAAGAPPSPPINPPLAEEPLVNGGFEEGFSGHLDGEANGWIGWQSRGYYGQTSCTFSPGTDQAFAGTRSQKIVIARPITGPQSAGIAQQVQVTRGASYQVTARFRLNLQGGLLPGDVLARLGLGTAGHTYFGEASVNWTDAPTTLNTWHTVTAIATAQNDYLTVFTGGLHRRSDVPGTATLWIDSVEIEPYTGPLPPPPLPVVDNFSFESGIAPWTMWIGTGGNSDPLERDAPGGLPDAFYCLAVKGLGSGGKGASLYIANNWHNQRQYRINAWCRNLANSGMRYSIGYALGNVGAAGAATASYGTEVTGTSAWQLISKSFTYTGSDEGVTLYLKAVNAGASERAGFDKIFIEDITPIGPPIIARTPASISRTVRFGENLPDETLTIQNVGGGALTYTISDNASWLSTSPTGGTSLGETDFVTVSLNTATLSVGTHTATITISDSTAANSPQTVPVAVTVEAAPLPGDMDGDADVDQEDFGRFQTCLGGPGEGNTEPDCAEARLDNDDDVDAGDLFLFTQCFSGPNNPPPIGCAGQ